MLSNLYSKFRRITTNQLYFPEIDGIRFVAIVLVILFHTHGYFLGKSTMHFTDTPGSHYWLDTVLYNGDRGVELFFVLSGFILCLPFAHHYINHGKKVQLKRYYLRRVTRLEPPYFIAMTAIFLMHLAMHTHPLNVLVPHWLASLAYSHNIIYHQVPLLTVVAWSLEIEIQFYLLAPLLFSLLALNKFTRRSILVTASVTLMVFQSFYTPSFNSIYGYAQYFFTGILLADFYVSDTASSFFNRRWIAPLGLACLVAILYWPLKVQYQYPRIALCAYFAFPFLLGLFYYIIMKNDMVKKVFGYKFIPIIGGMCYSIYLLHYTIISFLGRYTLQLHLTSYYLPNLLLQIVLIGLPVIMISSVFYLYIERPFMSSKWMNKLMKKDAKHEETNMQAEVETEAR